MANEVNCSQEETGGRLNVQDKARLKYIEDKPLANEENCTPEETGGGSNVQDKALAKRQKHLNAKIREARDRVTEGKKEFTKPTLLPSCLSKGCSGELSYSLGNVTCQSLIKHSGPNY